MYAAQQAQHGGSIGGSLSPEKCSPTRASDMQVIYERLSQFNARMEKFEETMRDRLSSFASAAPVGTPSAEDRPPYYSPATMDFGDRVEQAHITLTRLYNFLDLLVL